MEIVENDFMKHMQTFDQHLERDIAARPCKKDLGEPLSLHIKHVSILGYFSAIQNTQVLGF